MNTSATDQGARRAVKARDVGFFRAWAAWLAARKVRPNTISWLSVFCAAVAGACLFSLPLQASTAKAVGALICALVFIQLRLICNLLDGLVAVEGGLKTKSGEIFNDLPDRLSDPLILIGAGYAAQEYPMGIVLGWLAALLAVMTAYVRVLGQATGAGQFYLGPMAKQHRMAAMSLVLLAAAIGIRWVPPANFLGGGLVLIVTGCVVTIVRRAVRIVKTLEET